jgi:transposase
LGLEHTAIEDIEYDGTGPLVVRVRPMARVKNRCGRCRRPSPRYDNGQGRRYWRSLDLSTTLTYLSAEAPRVRCRSHGVVVAHVPWATHGAGHTHAFDQQVAWLTVRYSQSAVGEFMRVAWRTVGAMVGRVWDSAEAAALLDGLGDGLDGLVRIGIDEISYKRGQRYLTVVVDHDSGRLVWAAPGREKATLERFFDALGEARSALITHVSADGADWISAVVARRCPNAVRCADPFHIVKWATEALDDVRRQAWNAARSQPGGRSNRVRWSRGRIRQDAAGAAKALKHARYALWKNPENLTSRQAAKLAWIAKTDPTLHRAYLLKEGLRLVFQLGYDEAVEALEVWIGWARRCRIPTFVDLQRRIVKHKPSILAAIEHGLSNGRIESVNTKIRLITRVAFGFKSPDALIALAMLNLGGHRPVLPGRK